MQPDQPFMIHAILTVCCGLILLFALFVLGIARRQRRKLLLNNDLLESELLLLENERTRIAADLHDELGSLMSAIKLNLQCVDPANPESAATIDRISVYIDATMEKMRNISSNLLPVSLRLKGLFAAVDEFVGMVRDAGKVVVRYVFPEGKRGINDQYDGHLYRIIREATNNSLKHANATLIDICISYPGPGKLLLDIRDDGQGFNVQFQSLPAGRGIANIRRRVDVMNGRMTLTSTPQNGTRYIIELPI
jgi:signal transduction histidine kinase